MFRIFPLNEIKFRFEVDPIHGSGLMARESIQNGEITLYLSNYYEHHKVLSEMIDHIMYSLVHEEIHKVLDFKIKECISHVEHERIICNMIGYYRRRTPNHKVFYYTPKEMHENGFYNEL